MKIAIVGAGIAGLAIGWRLAQEGQDVTVFERDVAGRSATWAAAGMLSAGAEANAMGGAQSFARVARNQWPEFARELEEASGRRIMFREIGALVVGHDTASVDSLRGEGERLRAAGASATLLDAKEARALEPALAPHIAGALLVDGDADVDNRVLGEALRISFAHAGGVLRERTPVQSLLIECGCASGVLTAEGAQGADAVVIAMGAWSGALAGVPADALPPVRPTKGQLVALSPPPGAIVPKQIICDHHVYVVPRADRVIIGATVEDAGFDTSVTGEARIELVNSAARIVPAAADWPLAESWAGLRPRSPDDAPLLGETALPGLFVASGQFRNGILFAPAVAEALACLVMGRRAPFPVAALDPRRFTAQ
jgi:glycine oxidase